MNKKRVLSLLVILGLIAILGVGTTNETPELPIGDVKEVAHMLGIPNDMLEAASVSDFLEAIVARLPVRDSTGVLMLEALNLSAEFVIGQEAVLAFETLPGATCEIEIIYLATDDSPVSLTDTLKTASTEGRVEWTWTIGTREPTKAIATVSAVFGECHVEGRFPFYISDQER